MIETTLMIIAVELLCIMVLQFLGLIKSTEKSVGTEIVTMPRNDYEPPIEEDSVIPMTDEHDEDVMAMFRNRNREKHQEF